LSEQTIEGRAPTKRVKGYKVKVHHQRVDEAEEQAKREAVAEVIVQALRRLQDQK